MARIGNEVKRLDVIAALFNLLNNRTIFQIKPVPIRAQSAVTPIETSDSGTDAATPGFLGS
jgi:hypothetical protein